MWGQAVMLVSVPLAAEKHQVILASHPSQEQHICLAGNRKNGPQLVLSALLLNK